jgi:hypothetical protein
MLHGPLNVKLKEYIDCRGEKLTILSSKQDGGQQSVPDSIL